MLNRYEKLGVIGRGPRATLYRGHVEGLSQERAIKELHREWLNNRHERDMFFDEAKVWASLKNQHLITIHDVVFEKGWLILELLRPIQTGFSQHAEADSIRRFLRQSCQALHEMHGSGRLHANLKPSNVLFSEKGGVVLADGRCVPLDQTQQLPAHRGSAKFLAPEMCESRLEHVGPSSDLYSLAFVLLDILLGKGLDTFAMKSQLTDQLSDQEDFETAWWRWHASRSEKLDPIHTLRPELPRRLTDILDRLTCKDHSQRFTSAADVLAELTEEQVESAGAARRGPIDAVPVAPVAPATAVATRVIDRPDAPIIIRIASGPRAGDMVGLSKSEFAIGSDPSCDLTLAAGDYPQFKGSTLQFRREVEGWTLACLGLPALWINQSRVGAQSTLKSGDMIRVSRSGPDLQFIVHNVGLPSVSDIALKFAPGLLQAAPALSVGPSAPAPPMPADRGRSSRDGGAAPIAPTPPMASASASAAPLPPSPVGVAPPSPPRAANASANASESVAPLPPSGVGPPPPAAKKENFLTNLFRKQPKVVGAAGEDANKNNTYIAIVAVALLAMVVFLWPTGESPSGSAEQGSETSQTGEPAANATDAGTMGVDARETDQAESVGVESRVNPAESPP